MFAADCFKEVLYFMSRFSFIPKKKFNKIISFYPCKKALHSLYLEKMFTFFNEPIRAYKIVVITCDVLPGLILQDLKSRSFPPHFL